LQNRKNQTITVWYGAHSISTKKEKGSRLMHKILTATPKPKHQVYLEYDDGATFLIDLTPLIQPNTIFAILKDSKVFNTLEIGTQGRCIRWNDMLELDADALRIQKSPENGLQHDIIASTEATAITPDPVSLEVQRALKMAQVSQVEAAERTGLTQPTIARLANVHYHSHSIESLRKLSKGLGLQLEVRMTK
jgi:predicted XRE-type DNA-binding protein